MDFTRLLFPSQLAVPVLPTLYLFDTPLSNSWWKEYAARKNDEEEEHVADSLLYDERCHLPRTVPPPDCVVTAAAQERNEREQQRRQQQQQQQPGQVVLQLSTDVVTIISEPQSQQGLASS